MEYRAQTYLAALQCLVVISGTILVGFATKNYMPAFVGTFYLPRTLSIYGPWLLMVPAVWVIATISGERSFRWATKGFSIATGLAVLGGLAWLFVYGALMPCRMAMGN